ncbi:hypothetical protein CR513_24559, partial [Mucuna pruriens]
MTRSSSSKLHPLDLKIDKTLNRLRKTKNINIGSSSINCTSQSRWRTTIGHCKSWLHWTCTNLGASSIHNWSRLNHLS